MNNIIIVFPKIENGMRIKHILQQAGFGESAVCTTGAKTLQRAHELPGGIVLCGFRLLDMIYEELYESLPPGFQMLLAASKEHCEARSYREIICLHMPFKVHELIQTLHMMSDPPARAKRSFGKKMRTKEEEEILRRAKELLMNQNGMTEDEAHKYLQKCSMDNGVGMVETAQMVLSLF